MPHWDSFWHFGGRIIDTLVSARPVLLLFGLGSDKNSSTTNTSDYNSAAKVSKTHEMHDFSYDLAKKLKTHPQKSCFDYKAALETSKRTPIWETFWAILDPFWALLPPFWSISALLRWFTNFDYKTALKTSKRARFWTHFGPFWAHFAHFWAISVFMGPFWDLWPTVFSQRLGLPCPLGVLFITLRAFL